MSGWELQIRKSCEDNSGTISFYTEKYTCHRVLVRYIIHLYCLAVQVGFYSDVVECSTIDRRVPGSILGRGMEIFLRVRDKWRPTFGAIVEVYFYLGPLGITLGISRGVSDGD